MSACDKILFGDTHTHSSMKDVWQVITATSAVIWQHCFDVLLIIVLTSSLSITFCMYFLFCTIRKITSEYSKRERNERIGKNKDKRSMQKYYGHDRSILQHWHRKKFWFKTETITKRCRRFAPHTHIHTQIYSSETNKGIIFSYSKTQRPRLAEHKHFVTICLITYMLQQQHPTAAALRYFDETKVQSHKLN